MGAATASSKPLIVGVGWIVLSLAAASQLASAQQPAWSRRALISIALAVIPLAYFFRGMARSGSHWRCLRCRAEFRR